jgi:hypothetical protein
MKVILSAFGGRLISDIMEWPENTTLDIRLPLDLDELRVAKADDEFGDSYTASPKEKRIGRFRATKMHKAFRNGDTAREYVLVAIE